MPKVSLPSGIRLHYQRIGSGPDVVMVHGLTGNLAVWHLRIASLLVDRFRLLTYDLRGHGYSDMPPAGYSLDQMATDLLDLLDALNIERPYVVGHSFGADIALYFAHHHPERVRAVVAIEAVLPAMMYLRAGDDWQGWADWADVLERSGHPVPPERRTDLGYLLRLSLKVPKRWGPLQGLPRNPAPFLRLLDGTSMATEVAQVGGLPAEAIPEIRSSVTLVYCEGSALLGTFDYLRERLPDVHPVLLPRTDWGHFGPLEQPDEVARHILGALDRAEPSTATAQG
ncbi:alpha/beta hydrolase [Micromonospora sp. FIMYZ51]|uniref:alpha/beta fold hydrolase n=1 Tax=Micromonospora sp. FIMYZ51 TaxID=3051832 RepID=UPI00311DF571